MSNFIVIGGGIIGLATARELHKSGASVTVVDAGYPPCSHAATGILSALPPWHAPPAIATAIKINNQKFFNLVHEVENESDYRCEWRRSGMLAVNQPVNHAAGEIAPPDSIYAPVFSLAPHLNVPHNSHGLWMPSVWQVHSAKLTAGLTAVLKKQGVNFVHGAARLEYSPRTNIIDAVRLADGTQLRADTYVLSAGAYSAAICPPPAPPIKPIRGQAIVYSADKPLLPIVLGRGGLYLLPRHNGLLLVGSSLERAGFDNRSSAATLADLHRQAAALFPCLREARQVNAWSGLRPWLAGDLPVIAGHPRYDNLYLNTGHFRYGVTVAVFSARHLYKIMKNKTADNPFAFRTEWSNA